MNNARRPSWSAIRSPRLLILDRRRISGSNAAGSLHVILSGAKDLKTRNLRSFAVFAAQDDDGNPMRRSNFSNRGSFRSDANRGLILINGSALDRSSYALLSHSNASSVFPSAM